jgi:hypothetical protein
VQTVGLVVISLVIQINYNLYESTLAYYLEKTMNVPQGRMGYFFASISITYLIGVILNEKIR